MLCLSSRREVWYMIIYYKDLTLDIGIHSQVPYLEEPFLFTHSFTHQFFPHENEKDINIQKSDSWILQWVMYKGCWEFWGKSRDFWFQEVMGSQIHGKSDIWIGYWRIYIMRFDGGKDILGIAKTYKHFWRISKNQVVRYIWWE